LGKVKIFIRERITTSKWYSIVLTTILYPLIGLLFFFGILFNIYHLNLLELILGIVATTLAAILLCITIWFTIFSIRRLIVTIAIEKLQRLSNEENIDGLIDLIKKGYCQWAPIRKLGEFKKDADKAVPIIIQELKENKNKSVRVAACLALGEIKNNDAISVLLEIIKSDPEPLVRLNALHALSKFNKKFKEKLPEIYTIMKNDSNLKNRVNIALSFGFLNVIEALPIIKDVYFKDIEIEEKFRFGWSIALLEGINSDVINDLEEIVSNNQLSRKSKKFYKNKFYRSLVTIERSKKKTRKKKVSSNSEIELVRKEIQTSHEETLNILEGLKTSKEQDEKKQVLVPLLQAIIAAITAIITTLLVIYLR